MAKELIILCPYPINKAPSQRFRFEQYLEKKVLKGKIPLRSFYSSKGMQALYGSNLILKLFYLLFFFFRRNLHVLEAISYKKIFIHRELSPLGPPFYEWFLTVLGKEIIYDFDDAIWLSNVSKVNKKFDFIKAYWKVPKIIKWAKLVTVGNSYLGQYAKQFNINIKIVPSTVDTESVHNELKVHLSKDLIRVGWTGSHTTAEKYLSRMVDVLKKLNDHLKFEFVVISNQCPQIELENLVFIPWNKETEIADLLTFDIGIMPMGNEEWENGKCSFKAIQYMALGIPTVLSPYGNNIEVVDNNSDGLYASNDREWFECLAKLIVNHELRKRLGEKARKKIIEHYSLKSQEEHYRSIFS